MAVDNNTTLNQKRPTLKTIAEITGLAVTTVSRALSGAPEIAIATRKRVAEVAEQISYVPDRAAQRLRTGRTKVISHILHPHDEILGFSNSMIMGLTKALRHTNYNLVVTPSFDESTEIKTIQKIIRNRAADGIIFSRTEPFDERIRLLMENDFPFVSHGRTEFSTPHMYLDYDNTEFAQLGVNRLVSKGRTRLLAFMPDRKFTFYGHLKYGFTSAAIDAGVSYDVPEEVNLDSPADEVYAAMDRRLKGANPPNGVICAGEATAMTVMACISDNGLLVGQDVDMVVKKASNLFDHIRPKVDTIFEDITEAGTLMGEMLINQINDKPSNNNEKTGFIQKPISCFLD